MTTRADQNNAGCSITFGGGFTIAWLVMLTVGILYHEGVVNSTLSYWASLPIGFLISFIAPSR